MMAPRDTDVQVEDFTEDFVIFEDQGTLKAAPYTMAGGKANVGEAFEVQKQYVKSQNQAPAGPVAPPEMQEEVPEV